MIEKVLIVALLAIVVFGCAQVLPKDEAEPVTAPVFESPAEIKAVLADALKDAAVEVRGRLEQTQWYQTGEGLVTSVMTILGALGVGVGVVQGKRRKAAAEGREKAQNKAFNLATGLRVLEEAVLKAGKEGKAVTGNIKEKGAANVAAVDTARRLAHENVWGYLD